MQEVAAVVYCGMDLNILYFFSSVPSRLTNCTLGESNELAVQKQWPKNQVHGSVRRLDDKNRSTPRALCSAKLKIQGRSFVTICHTAEAAGTWENSIAGILDYLAKDHMMASLKLLP